MEKYYDLIASLVKSHRKYPGCESILDDIVRDVYDHAEVVLKTVSNESVISSYLNKIVSTSMITVPKRFGINKKKEVKLESSIQLESNDYGTTELTEADLDMSDSESAIENELNDIAISYESDVMSEKIKISSIEPTEIKFSEQIKPEESELLEQDLKESDVDKTLVDKMINGISDLDEEVLKESADATLLEDETELTIDEIDDISIEEPSEELSLDEEPDATMDVNENITLNEPDEKLSFEEEVESDIGEEEDLIADETAEELPVEQGPEQIIDVTENLANDEPVEELPDGQEVNIAIKEQDLLGESDTDELSVEQETEFETNETEKFEPLEPGLDDMLEVDAQDDIVAISDNDAELEELPESEPSDFVDLYKKFEYSPEPVDIDEDEIRADINVLDSKNPDKHIKEICKLKYEAGLSVSDIASKLELAEADIIEALNEIIYTVKD